MPNDRTGLPTTIRAGLVALAGALISLATATQPTANAGGDRDVVAGLSQLVELDASASGGAAGDPLRFDWHLAQRPSGSAATLVDSDAARTRFTPDMAGVYVVELIVADGGGQGFDRVTVTAACPEPDPLSGIFDDTVLLEPKALNCVDYVITGDVQFRADATIEPGTWIDVAANRRILVHATGTLRASGTRDRPIRIVGSSDEPGHWASLAIASSDPRNVLRHVTIAHGGRRSANSNHHETMLFVPTAGRVRIVDSTLVDSSGYGVYADRGADLTGFARNRLGGHAVAPLRVDVLALEHLDAASDYGEPERDAEEVRFVEVGGSPVDVDRTWPALGVPMRLERLVNLTDGATLTIAPGAVLEFGSRAGIVTACEDEVLHAVGTASAPITMRGIEPGPGTWGGIHLCSRGANRLEHVAITGAGEARLVSGRAEAAVTLAAEAHAEVRFAAVSGTPAWGIHAHPTANLVPADPLAPDAGNTFEDTPAGGVSWR